MHAKISYVPTYRNDLVITRSCGERTRFRVELNHWERTKSYVQVTNNLHSRKTSKFFYFSRTSASGSWEEIYRNYGVAKTHLCSNNTMICTQRRGSENLEFSLDSQLFQAPCTDDNTLIKTFTVT